MPGDWAQRVRRLGDNAAASETMGKIGSRTAVSNPSTSAVPRQPPVTWEPAPGSHPAGVHNPFSAATVPPPRVPDFNVGQAVPVVSSRSGALSAAPTRPVAVKVAACALLAAAVLTLAIGGMGAYAITELRTTVDHVLDLDQSGTATLVASGYADDTQMILMAVSVAIAAVMAVAYLLVTKSIWSGRSWPRTVSPFLVVLSLPAIFVGPLATIIVLVGAVATAAAWMPSARAYSQQEVVFRDAARSGGGHRSEGDLS